MATLPSAFEIYIGCGGARVQREPARPSADGHEPLERQPDRHRGAGADRAFDLEPSAMALDDAAAYRQAKADAFLGTVEVTRRLPERFGDARQILDGDADAGVGDVQ